MTPLPLLIAVAALGGAATAFQAQFMGTMDRGIGTLESVFITYVSGAMVIGLVMLALRGGNLAAWSHVPWYSFGAGFMGLIIVGAIGYSVPRLGLVVTFTIMVSMQFLVGALLDHFGLVGAAVRPLDLSRLLGMAILMLGTWLTIR